MECSCCWVCPDYPWFGLVHLPYAIPLFHVSFPFKHEYTLVSFCSENGFEEGLSTLGLVSGLFGAMWSVGWVALEFNSLVSWRLLFPFYRWRNSDTQRSDELQEAA